MKKDNLSEKVKRANIVYHTVLSESYNQQQPYFRPENLERVDKLVHSFIEKSGTNFILDVACGTGFMLGIAKKYFDYCIGFDITPAMLRKAKENFCKEIAVGKIILCLSDAYNMPFRDGIFNVCSIYSSLHHFSKLEPVFRETFRMLKNGGIFYSDEDPNFYFFRDLKVLNDMINNNNQQTKNYSNILKKEINSVNKVDREIKIQYGINEKTTSFAEYQKLVKGGMKKKSLEKILKKIGFNEVDSKYRWYLGQGEYIHKSPEVSNLIDQYLRTNLPFSKNFFKYFYIIATK